MLEFLSPGVRLLLFTVTVAFILILIMEFFNVELPFGGGSGIRAFLAIVIAVAIYTVFERISHRFTRGKRRFTNSLTSFRLKPKR